MPVTHDEHVDFRGKTAEECQDLVDEASQLLPAHVVDRILELSYDFMAYPDDIARLGVRCYRSEIERAENGT